MITLIKRKGINPQTKNIIYFPQWTRVATVDENQLSKRMARGSTYSIGEISGVMQDFPAYIMDELLDGNAVRINGLGTFKLRVSGKSKADIKEVTSAGCSVAVTFEPDMDLTARLNTEREFRFVAKPTEEGEQDVNTDTPAPSGDNPDTPGGGDTPENPGGNGDNPGGGDNGGDLGE